MNKWVKKGGELILSQRPDTRKARGIKRLMKLVNIGYGNMVNTSRIVSVVSPDAAPIKRLVQDTRSAGRLVDATGGKKTRSVIVSDSGHIILSALTCETIQSRIAGGTDNAEDEENE